MTTRKMNMSKKSKGQSKTKREAILNAGVRLFARVPFTDVTIAAVAREAECGHSLVYHYFPNVNTLYDEAVDYVAIVFLNFIRHLNSKNFPPELVFVGVISRLLDSLKVNGMFAYYMNIVSFNHSLAPRNEKNNIVQSEWIALFVKIIEAGQKNGNIITILTPLEILRALQTTFQGLTSSQIFSIDSDKNTLRAADIYLPFLKGAH